jgi:IS5 family transposase
MRDALIELPPMRSFADTDLISVKVPDETTILSFRHLLEKNKLRKEIFNLVKQWRARAQHSALP